MPAEPPFEPPAEPPVAPKELTFREKVEQGIRDSGVDLSFVDEEDLVDAIVKAAGPPEPPAVASTEGDPI
jgi:hypothetical protein